MNLKRVFFVVILYLSIVGFVRAESVLEDFESYPDTADLLETWSERNPTVGTIELSASEAKDGGQSMKYTYSCNTTPYWSEAFTIFPQDEDWSGYKTLTLWIKGRDTSQSLEDMYLVLYSAQEPNPVDHSGLSMLGKTRFYEVTQDPNWLVIRADIAFNFEPLYNVRAVGFGMSPTYYGSGVMHIDALVLEEKSYGGLINDFEDYADTAELLDSGDVGTNDANQMTIEIETLNPDNIFAGEKSLKVSYDNGVSPYFAKVAFTRPFRFNPNWSPYKANYNPLTIHFKVEDPEGSIQVVLIDKFGLPTAVYKYDDPNSLQEPGDWIRWDIDPTTVYDYEDPEETFTELDYVKRVEVQFMPGDYGQGVVYLDNLHINVCGDGPFGVGDLDADLNLDCVVDLEDVATFASNWLATNCSSANDHCDGADFSLYGSYSGTVDLDDLMEIVSEWLDCNLYYRGDCFGQ